MGNRSKSDGSDSVETFSDQFRDSDGATDKEDSDSDDTSDLPELPQKNASPEEMEKVKLS